MIEADIPNVLPISEPPLHLVVFVSACELANMSSKVVASSFDFDASLILITYHPTVPAPLAGLRASSR
jgi:hypothetical protein